MGIKYIGGSVSGTLGPQEITVRGTLGLQAGPRCMGTTIRSTISSPSTSNNNLALLGYGSMCVGTLVHIARYQGKTSNNNRFQLLILVTLAIHVMIPVLYSCLTFI